MSMQSRSQVIWFNSRVRSGRISFFLKYNKVSTAFDEVGNDYIALYQPDEQSYISADLYSIRFVEFLPEISQTNSRQQQQP